MKDAGTSARYQIGATLAEMCGQRLRRAIVRLLVLAFWGALACAGLQGAIHAQSEARTVVHSEGRNGTVEIEATDASVRDVIEALARTLGFEILGDAPSTDLRITRRLEGSLEEILLHVLHDANYLLVTGTGGAPKRLVFLSPAPVTVDPYAAMSVDQLRKQESELVAQIAQYEDLSQEARERSRPELAQKFERQINELSREMDAVRARLPP